MLKNNRRISLSQGGEQGRLWTCVMPPAWHCANQVAYSTSPDITYLDFVDATYRTPVHSVASKEMREIIATDGIIKVQTICSRTNESEEGRVIVIYHISHAGPCPNDCSISLLTLRSTESREDATHFVLIKRRAS